MGYGFSKERISRPEASRYTSQRKQVFGTHANTAHAWAQQNVAYGRSSDGRIYFEGATIYSYGSHFPIAQFTSHKVGERQLVLFTSDSYSVSTSSHIGEARGALRGLRVHVLYTPNLKHLDTQHPESCRVYADEAFDVLVTRLGSHLALEQDAAHERQDCEAFRKLFKITRRIPDNPALWVERRASLAADRARAVKIDNAKRAINEPCDFKLHAQGDANTWRAQDDKNRLLRELKKLRSARLTLGKKKFPSYCKKATAHIRTLEALIPVADAAIDRARAAERHQRLSNELAAIVSGKRDYFIDRLSSATQLHAFALAEGRPDDARKVLDLVHVVQFREETAWRAPNEWSARYASKRATHKPLTAEQWQDGAGDASQYHIPQTLVRRKGDRLQTSRGAEAPWKLCVLAFVIAQECRRTGSEWIKNGKRLNLGNYELDRVDGDGTLYAGCHTIDWPEMLRLAVRETPHSVAPRYPLPVVIGN